MITDQNIIFLIVSFTCKNIRTWKIFLRFKEFKNHVAASVADSASSYYYISSALNGTTIYLAPAYYYISRALIIPNHREHGHVYELRYEHESVHVF